MAKKLSEFDRAEIKKFNKGAVDTAIRVGTGSMAAEGFGGTQAVSKAAKVVEKARGAASKFADKLRGKGVGKKSIAKRAKWDKEAPIKKVENANRRSAETRNLGKDTVEFQGKVSKLRSKDRFTRDKMDFDEMTDKTPANIRKIQALRDKRYGK